MSTRHTLATGRLPRDEPRDTYLDSARDCILDIGWRRTTLTEVARRAGVSRMTIYRSWSEMRELLADLMTREWGYVTFEAATVAKPGFPAGGVAATRHLQTQGVGLNPSQADSPTHLAHDVLGAVRALRRNELFVRIVEVDPELILPYLLARRGRSQQAVVDLLATAIAEGQTSGAVRAGEPVQMSRAIVLAAHGFVLSTQTMVDDHVSEADLDEELSLLVTRMLAP